MNDLISSGILGAIQGVTEFLPISSSGHVALAEHFLGISYVKLAFIAVIHLGTLAAILVYFWRDIFSILKTLNKAQSVGWKIAVGTIPAVLAGLALGSTIEEAIQDVRVIAGALAVTGLLLIVSEIIMKRNANKPKDKVKDWHQVTYSDALLIGIAQMTALIPGISRSGTTMAAGLLRGLPREQAVRFSFLLSSPVVAGAGLYSLIQLLQEPEAATGPGVLIVGFIASFLVGLATIHLFLKNIRKHTFNGYGIYAILIAVAALAWSFIAR